MISDKAQNSIFLTFGFYNFVFELTFGFWNLTFMTDKGRLNGT